MPSDDREFAFSSRVFLKAAQIKVPYKLWHYQLLTMVENELAFPFQAKVLGTVVTVVGMEWPEDDEFGLDLVIERDGEQHRVEARSVDLLPPFPAGHLYLAAYLDWKRML